MQKIPLAQYITQNNYSAAEQLVMANGFNKPQNEQQTLNALNLLLVRNGVSFLAQLADAHPDYELIAERVREKEKSIKEIAQKNDKKSNADGDDKNSNANGQNSYKSREQRKQMFIDEMQKADEKTSNLDGVKTAANDDKYIKMLVIGCTTILAGILIYKIA